MILLSTLNAKFIHSSLALYTLKAFCGRDFPGIAIREFNINQDLDWILGEIYKLKPKVVGLSTNIWNVTPQLELVDRLKKISPETIVLMGGPEVSAEPEGLMERAPGVDYLARGEGEETFYELLQTLREGRPDPAAIKGLVYREGDRIRVNPPRPPIKDLALIPFPYDDVSVFKNRLVYYEASRGCAFNCAYCLSGWEKTPVRYLPVERVKADLEQLIAAEIPTVKFVDRTFNLDSQRAMEILRFIAKKGGKTQFHLEIVGELLSEELIDFFTSVPPDLFRLEIGVQSAHIPALKEVGRFYHPEKLAANVKRISQAGRALLHLDLIAGLPHEDLSTFARSFDWTYRLQPDELQLGFLKLLKGSPLREKAAEYGYLFTNAPPYEILESNWLTYDQLRCLKIIEDMVEKFHNSGRYRHILSFFFSQSPFEPLVPVSPWEFFHGLALFWEENFLYGRALKSNALFDWFWRYLQSRGYYARDKERVRDLLTLDFYLAERGDPGFSWLRKEDREAWAEIREAINRNPQSQPLLPAPYADLSYQELKRRAKVFNIRIDPATLKEERIRVMVYSPVGASPSWFRLPNR